VFLALANESEMMELQRWGFSYSEAEKVLSFLPTLPDALVNFRTGKSKSKKLIMDFKYPGNEIMNIVTRVFPHVYIHSGNMVRIQIARAKGGFVK